MSRTIRALVATSVAVVATGLAACDAPADDAPRATPTTPSPTVDTCATETVAAMSTEQRVAQLMMVGVDARDLPRAAKRQELFELGGAVLTGTSKASASTVARRLAIVAKAGDGPAPFLAVARISGPDATLRGSGFARLPSAAAQGSWSPADVVAGVSDVARDLHAAGVTMALEPVADTSPTDDGSGTDDRYGTSPEAVSERVHLTAQSLVAQDVAPVTSSFPGDGALAVDPTTTRVAEDGELTLDDPTLAPFRTAVGAGTRVVRLSAATFTRIDPEHPATFSPKVVAALRDDLGFTGLIMSADLSSSSKVALPVRQRGVAFLKAGGDVVLSEGGGQSTTLIDGMVAAAERSTDFADLVTAAAERVVSAKVTAGLVRCD